MNEKPVLSSVEDIKSLAKRLSRIPEVRQLDQPDEPQSWTIAFTLSELEESFRRFLQELLPRLQQDSLTPKELHAVLIEIGDEFRHILYHLNDSESYGRHVHDDPT